MLIDVIRKVVPMRERQDIGLWITKQAGRSKFLAYPYFFLLCGTIPLNLRLLSHEECAVTYLDEEKRRLETGYWLFRGVSNKVYEKLWSPKEGDVVWERLP